MTFRSPISIHLTTLITLTVSCLTLPAPAYPASGATTGRSNTPKVSPAKTNTSPDIRSSSPKGNPTNTANTPPPITNTQNTQLLPSERDTIHVFKQISPYVVNVHNVRMLVNPYLDIYRVKKGIGSGILWNTNGYIVTNDHVIRGANKLLVTLIDGYNATASIVGHDARDDIAVLKISVPNGVKDHLPQTHIPVANSSHLQVGQQTIAIGNPFGLERTLTVGVISALGRNVPTKQRLTMRAMIQTDASINPGNSGGPLLNSAGQLIGMNTMIYSGMGTSIGVGFAIPSNIIQSVVKQLIEHGHVIRPGIGIRPLPQLINQRLKVNGVVVGKIIPHSPADKAGLRGTKMLDETTLQLGDVITAIDGTPVRSFSELFDQLQTKQLGQTIQLTYVRHQNKHTVALKTADLHQNK